jgi:cytochrome P450
VHDFTAGIAGGADAHAVVRANAAAEALMAQGEEEGLPRFAAANRIAFMQQSLDATAGLIGNTILAVREREVRDFEVLVAEVAERDPAVHNTRRFAAADLHLGGQRIEAGQGMVLLLAGNGLGFGAGAHACPGERIAKQIAASGLQALAPLSRWFGAVTGYRPLPNARVPVFASL